MSHGSHVGIRGQHAGVASLHHVGFRDPTGHLSAGFLTCSLCAELLRPVLSSYLVPAELATVAFMGCENVLREHASPRRNLGLDSISPLYAF